ncbi:ABC transporter ATP-binding protein [Streptomyces caniscabiei]|uniref:ABC transporter ATP-binding protein n=1 Tax=Streptomyces caniscabiei TaxID=2746961 RepID=UPI00076603F2|nr:ABC transporter ATP-binding protein [Streptomyces caniscabiei]
MNTASAVLTGTGLFKSYGMARALAGVDVDVTAGESLAVMGPSGSGKSTLLHCLAGIERPDSGEVLLDSRRVDQLREPARSELRRTAFGFVFQSGQLLPELPADENVALPLMLGGTPRRAAVAQARQWFGPLGLQGLEARRPGQLSGGQAQRVAIARALVGKPKVIFADEPTGALDSLASEQVMAALTHAARESGTAVLLITHDAQTAAYADREVVLKDGVVVSAADVTLEASR